MSFYHIVQKFQPSLTVGFWLIFFSVCTLRCFAGDQLFGLVASQGEYLCVSFGNQFPPLDKPLTLVSTEAVQYAVVAKRGEKTQQCKLLENGQVAGPYFWVRTHKKFTSPFVGIAVYGKYQKIQSDKGAVVLKIINAKKTVQFRVCNSHEGFWFSAWLGPPLTGQALWRQYFYLGYDVEPNCEEKDFAEEE